MSKPVRISDYLHAEVERLAAVEKRSTANMVQILLEQALAMDHTPVTKRIPVPGGEAQVSTTPRIERRAVADDPHFKPDFKKAK